MRLMLELRVEIVIVVAQRLELLEIGIVIDAAEQPAELAELFALAALLEGAVFAQRLDDVGLAHRDELIARVGAGRRRGAACGRSGGVGRRLSRGVEQGPN